MIGDTLKADEYVGENKPLFKGSNTLAESVYVTVSDFGYQGIYDLLKGFNAFCKSNISFAVRLNRHRNDFIQSLRHYGKLTESIV